MKFLERSREKNILKRIEKGDENSFVRFYDRYAVQVYRFIYLKINSPQDSEDLTSEAFLRFWNMLQGRASFSGKNSNEEVGIIFNSSFKNPRALIYQIARNLVIDYYRKKPRAELIIDEEKEKALENIHSQDSNLAQKAALDSDLVQIKKALGRIGQKYQDLIIWHYLDDFSVKEIAQILEKPQNTIRVQLFRALELLRKELK